MYYIIVDNFAKAQDIIAHKHTFNNLSHNENEEKPIEYKNKYAVKIEGENKSYITKNMQDIIVEELE